MGMFLIDMGDFNLATLIVGIISLCGVMVNIVVTSLNNRKKRYVDLIISERIRNMKNLEKYMSELISTLYAFMTPNCNFDVEFKNFEYNKQMILYSMNFLLGSDKSIGDALCKLDDLLFDYSQNVGKLNKKQKEEFNKTVRAGINVLQILTRIYNKCEWERSKDSSLNGEHTHYDVTKEFEKYLESFKENLDVNLKILNENSFEKILQVETASSTSKVTKQKSKK